MRPPLGSRLRARPAPPNITTTHQSGGVVGLDVGAALAQLDWRQLLEDLNLRGRV